MFTSLLVPILLVIQTTGDDVGIAFQQAETILRTQST